MGSETLSLFLDILVLTGLVTTIYFALKLSKSLNNFKKHRKDFERTVQDLNENIERAHSTLSALRGLSGGGDIDMDRVLNESRALIEELSVMNQAGQNIASRLENLSTRSGDFTEDSSDHDYDEQIYGNIAAFEAQPSGDGDVPFAIQDRDFEDSDQPPLQSQAEKELFQALQKNKKRSTGRAS